MVGKNNNTQQYTPHKYKWLNNSGTAVAYHHSSCVAKTTIKTIHITLWCDIGKGRYESNISTKCDYAKRWKLKEGKE
jgi:hypothetical protein